MNDGFRLIIVGIAFLLLIGIVTADYIKLGEGIYAPEDKCASVEDNQITSNKGCLVQLGDEEANVKVYGKLKLENGKLAAGTDAVIPGSEDLARIFPSKLKTVAPTVSGGEWGYKVEERAQSIVDSGGNAHEKKHNVIVLTAKDDTNVINGQEVPKGTRFEYDTETGEVRVLSAEKEATDITLNGRMFKVPENGEMIYKVKEEGVEIVCPASCSIGEIKGVAVKTSALSNTILSVNKDGSVYLEDGGVVFGGEDGKIASGHGLTGRRVLITPKFPAVEDGKVMTSIKELTGGRTDVGHVVAVTKKNGVLQFMVLDGRDLESKEQDYEGNPIRPLSSYWDETLFISTPDGLVYRFNQDAQIDGVIDFQQPGEPGDDLPSLIISTKRSEGWRGVSFETDHSIMTDSLKTNIDLISDEPILKNTVISETSQVKEFLRQRFGADTLTGDYMLHMEDVTGEEALFKDSLKDLDSYLKSKGISDLDQIDVSTVSVFEQPYSLVRGLIEGKVVKGITTDNKVRLGYFDVKVPSGTEFLLYGAVKNMVESEMKWRYLSKARLDPELPVYIEPGTGARKTPQYVIDEMNRVVDWMKPDLGVRPVYFIQREDSVALAAVRGGRVYELPIENRIIADIVIDSVSRI